MFLKFIILSVSVLNMINLATTQGVVPCPENIGNGVCKNNGFCVVIFNRDIQVIINFYLKALYIYKYI